MQC
ncbi:hypothetical protein YPPY58_0848, partial [Yersinia pestis PY-58]|jgi:Ca2+-binding EF-hand superfamily protein